MLTLLRISAVQSLLCPSVGRFCRQLQLVVDLVQEFFGLLSVTFQVPFIGLLGRNDLIVGVPGRGLCSREIRMARAGDVLSGLLVLRQANPAEKEQGTEDSGE